MEGEVNTEKIVERCVSVLSDRIEKEFVNSGIPMLDPDDPNVAPGWSWDDSFWFENGYVELHFDLMGKMGTCGKRHDNGDLPGNMAGGALVARKPEKRDMKLDVSALAGKQVSAALLVLAASVAQALPIGGKAMAGPLLVKRGVSDATVEWAEDGGEA